MSTAPPIRRPELLAPAGGWSQARAAIEAGADAIYFGLSDFNARARAANFDPGELAELVAMLHERGVLGFVTLNVLVWDDEIGEVAARIETIARAGADAVIVQDLGLLSLARAVAPELPVHASTQMTVTSAEGAAFVAELGARRVILARELSIAEIADVRRASPIEVEAFVHGALCVSYSGQCFSSEAWGGRSANRGQCAQACRLPYDLVVDGRPRDLGDLRYLLSPRDLMALDLVPDLVGAGVHCMKIEGRLKGPEYVALVTAAYRRAIDAACGLPAADRRPTERRELEQIFSRGLDTGFLEGPRHQHVVGGRRPKHSGLEIGQVTRVGRDRVEVLLCGPVKRGDGVAFDRGRPEEPEVGGRVYEVFLGAVSRADEPDAGTVALTFGPDFEFGRVREGERVWRTRDEALEARARAIWEHGVRRRDPVDAVVSGEAGRPLVLRFTDARGRSGAAESDVALSPAARRALDAAALRDALDRLGDTPFALGAVRCDLPPGLFLPIRALNDTRRRAAQALLEARRAPSPYATVPDAARALRVVSPAPCRSPASGAETHPRIALLCRTRAQVECARTLPDLHEVIVDLLDMRGTTEAIDSLRSSGRRTIVASPRVLKPNEERIWRFLLGLDANAILVRSLGLLHTLASLRDAGTPPLIGDFSLNAANRLASAVLLSAGLQRVTAPHDLDADQICALAAALPGGALEVIVHHHLPLFHMEHCVFARFLSTGNSWRDCGRPCESHTALLRDREGKDHLVQADLGCRNTVFHGQAQAGATWLEAFRRSGIAHYRIELVDESPEEARELVSTYVSGLRGEIEGAELHRRLSRQSRRGVTRGSLEPLRAAFEPRPTARR